MSSTTAKMQSTAKPSKKQRKQAKRGGADSGQSSASDVQNSDSGIGSRTSSGEPEHRIISAHGLLPAEDVVDAVAIEFINKAQFLIASPFDVRAEAPAGGKSKAELKAERRAMQEAQRAAKAAGVKLDYKEKKVAEAGHPVQLKDTVLKLSVPDGDKAKAALKAERRSLQEAQRLLKVSGKQVEVKTIPTVSAPRVPDTRQMDVADVEKRAVKKLTSSKIPLRKPVQRKIGLFKHLPQYERQTNLTSEIPMHSDMLHPAIIRLGLQYAEGRICGSNARCIALLMAFKQVIEDYVTPVDKDLSRDLTDRLKPYIAFLQQCRPISVSMGNAIKHLKKAINNVPKEFAESEAKRHLQEEVIDEYIRDKIEMADRAITNEAMGKITDGDVILTYACSSLIKRVLVTAHEKGRKFTVVVVDGRPKMEGLGTVRYLSGKGLSCSYVLISSVGYVMSEVTKVFLGAHALLANGYVMSRVGSSQVALVARSFNVPVLVCCETYKFCERVQTDSFVFNELGDPDDLVKVDQNNNEPVLKQKGDLSSLYILNLVYDVTPSDLVSVVITELGMIPCTSVPVVLRVKHE